MCSDHWRSFQNFIWQQNAKVWNSNISCTFVYLQRIIWMTLRKEIFFRSCVCVCVCVCVFFSTTNGRVQVYNISQKNNISQKMSNLEIFSLKKFLWQPNWTRPTASSNFGCPRNFFIQLFPNWTACSPITYTNPPFHFRPESETRAKIFWLHA